jgi:hypothetical protein
LAHQTTAKGFARGGSQTRKIVWQRPVRGKWMGLCGHEGIQDQSGGQACSKVDTENEVLMHSSSDLSVGPGGGTGCLHGLELARARSSQHRSGVVCLVQPHVALGDTRSPRACSLGPLLSLDRCVAERIREEIRRVISGSIHRPRVFRTLAYRGELELSATLHPAHDGTDHP